MSPLHVITLSPPHAICSHLRACDPMRSRSRIAPSEFGREIPRIAPNAPCSCPSAEKANSSLVSSPKSQSRCWAHFSKWQQVHIGSVQTTTAKGRFICTIRRGASQHDQSEVCTGIGVGSSAFSPTAPTLVLASCSGALASSGPLLNPLQLSFAAGSHDRYRSCNPVL